MGVKTNLGLHEALDLVGLGGEQRRKVAAGLERQDPHVQAENHGEHGADDGHVARELDPLAGRRRQAG